MTDQSFRSIEHPVLRGLILYCNPEAVFPNRMSMKELIMKTYHSKQRDLLLKFKNVKRFNSNYYRLKKSVLQQIYGKVVIRTLLWLLLITT